MKLLLVDDHPMVRKGLSSVLSAEDNVEEIREASSVFEAMKILESYYPDVAFIDLKLGKDNGLDIVSSIKKLKSDTKIIVLTSSSSRKDFLRAEEEGVDGYILKEAFVEDIIYAFRVVIRGKKFFDPEMIITYNNQQDVLTELTPREIEVLTELGKGMSNIQIAKQLYISENTVKKHITSILGKLGLSHRLEAAIYINNTFNC